MRKITSFSDFCQRVWRRLTKPFVSLQLKIYKLHEENTLGSEKEISQVTYYKVGNLGDTVLSQCVRRTLRLLCGFKTYNLIVVNKPVTDDTIMRINKTKMLVIGGGGLFLPDTNANSISGWQWAISEDQLQRIKVPVILYTVGYNYFRGQSSNELFEKNLRLIISKSQFVGLRNNGSCQAVKSILEDGAQDNVSRSLPEIVYQPCTTTLIRQIYPELPPKKRTGKIGINIAFDREKLRFGDDQELILTQIAKAMKTLVGRNYKLYYIAHAGIDLRFVPYLKKEGVRFKEINMSSWLPQKAIRFYNEIDCVFGMRGHAQMIPFGVNCEIISLGSHEKMRWFLDDIDSLDWYVELRQSPETLSERIVDTFTRIHEIEPEKTKERLLKAQEKLWKISQTNAMRINEILLS